MAVLAQAGRGLFRGFLRDEQKVDDVPRLVTQQGITRLDIVQRAPV